MKAKVAFFTKTVRAVTLFCQMVKKPDHVSFIHNRFIQAYNDFIENSHDISEILRVLRTLFRLKLFLVFYVNSASDKVIFIDLFNVSDLPGVFL